MPPAKKSKSAAKSGTVETAAKEAARKVGEVLEPVTDVIASGAKAVAFTVSLSGARAW